MLVAYLSDKYKHRGGFIAVLSLVCLAGCAIVAWHPNNNVRYFGGLLLLHNSSQQTVLIFCYQVAS
jgi:hypothetical protein